MFDDITHPQQRAFLSHYAQTGQVKASASKSKVSREAHYDWLRRDGEYAQAFAAAKRMACDALEDEAIKRAFSRSDRVLCFLLEHLKKDVYGKKFDVNVAATVRHEVDLSGLTDEELNALERLLDTAAAAAEAGQRGHSSRAEATEPEQARVDVPGDGAVSAGTVPEAAPVLQGQLEV